MYRTVRFRTVRYGTVPYGIEVVLSFCGSKLTPAETLSYRYSKVNRIKGSMSAIVLPCRWSPRGSFLPDKCQKHYSRTVSCSSGLRQHGGSSRRAYPFERIKPCAKRGDAVGALMSESGRVRKDQSESEGLSLQELQVLSQEWWKTDVEAGSQGDLSNENINPETVAAVVLGGGAGDGLYPLTQVDGVPPRQITSSICCC